MGFLHLAEVLDQLIILSVFVVVLVVVRVAALA
jgi:hypothetical protein